VKSNDKLGIATRTTKVSLSPDFCINDVHAVINFLNAVIETKYDHSSGRLFASQKGTQNGLFTSTK
jgi:hypothetical protein